MINFLKFKPDGFYRELLVALHAIGGSGRFEIIYEQLRETRKKDLSTKVMSFRLNRLKKYAYVKDYVSGTGKYKARVYKLTPKAVSIICPTEKSTNRTLT